jgi:hypothetical protein
MMTLILTKVSFKETTTIKLQKGDIFTLKNSCGCIFKIIGRDTETIDIKLISVKCLNLFHKKDEIFRASDPDFSAIILSDKGK